LDAPKRVALGHTYSTTKALEDQYLPKDRFENGAVRCWLSKIEKRIWLKYLKPIIINGGWFPNNRLLIFYAISGDDCFKIRHKYFIKCNHKFFTLQSIYCCVCKIIHCICSNNKMMFHFGKSQNVIISNEKLLIKDATMIRITI
jgi:hypothetical protein